MTAVERCEELMADSNLGEKGKDAIADMARELEAARCVVDQAKAALLKTTWSTIIELGATIDAYDAARKGE